MIAPKVAGSDTNVAIGERATRVSAGNPAECHLLGRMGMKRPAHQIARVAACLVLAAWLAGCQKGTLGDPAAGGAGQIMGVGARGASGIGAAGGDNSGFGGVGAPTGGIGGGFGGSGSAGGIGGGFGGSGGTGDLVFCPPPDPPVCGASCGNGRIDSCVAALSPECIPYALREDCDGAELGGASCAKVGYPSGTLVCDKTCSVASGTGCSECVPMAPSVVSCGTIPSLAAPDVATYAIAATDGEVGLAEVGYHDISGMTLSFRRLTPSLDTASSTTLLDTRQPGPLAGAYITGVAVAPIPSGWVIASCVSGNLHLFTVDAAGVNSLRAPAPDDRGCVGYGMVLAARPGGGPLLVWSPGYGVSGSFIAADGQSAGTPFEIVGYPTADGGMFDGAWVGDAFNVAVSAFVPPDYRPALRIVRIDVNGALTSRDVLMGDEFEDAPRIARGATDTRVTYVARLYPLSYDVDIKWRRFGSAGERLADAVLLTPVDNYTSSPAVAFGDDTLVLMFAEDLVSSLALTRVGPDGQILARPYDILRARPYAIGYFDMVRRGPDAIVSWLSYAGNAMRVGLVRITP
jgi:hypothetical protein